MYSIALMKEFKHMSSTNLGAPETGVPETKSGTPPSVVGGPEGFFTTDQILEAKRYKGPPGVDNRTNEDVLGANSPVLQLPAPVQVDANTRFLIINSSLATARMRQLFIGNIDPIISKSFYGNLRTKQFFENNLRNTNGEYDIIFVIDTEQFIQSLNFGDLYDRLKITGYLVLMTVPENPRLLGRPIDTEEMVKYTQFLNREEEPESLKQNFILFRDGHIFYMKRLQKNNLHSPTYISPLFATFSYSQNSLVSQEVIKDWSTTTNLFKVELDASEKRVVVKQTAATHQGYLPLNYVSGRGHANSLELELNLNWYKVSDCYKDETRMRDELRVLVKSLDPYFRTFPVRGGGDCMFVALNHLFALKAMRLLDIRVLFENINNLLLNLYQNDFQTWFIINVIDNKTPMSIQEVQQDLIIDSNDASNRSTAWLQLLAQILNIRIVLFDSRISYPHQLIYGHVSRFSTDDINKVPLNEMPTFFILNIHGHFYPLFPVRDLAFNTEKKLFELLISI